METGFANRTDEHLELVSPVLVDLQETGGAFLALEECSFHQQSLLLWSVGGAEGLEATLVLQEKAVFYSTRHVARLTT